MARFLLVLCLLTLVAGCTPPPAQPALQVWDGATRIDLTPGAGAYSRTLDAWQDLLAAVGARARTFYTPARFQQQIEPLPHLLVDYGTPRELAAKGIRFQAWRVVVAVAQGELIVLAQETQDGDWSVYLPANAAAAERFLTALQEATGVNLKTP